MHITSNNKAHTGFEAASHCDAHHGIKAQQ
jgi:hypothetical protein